MADENANPGIGNFQWDEWSDNVIEPIIPIVEKPVDTKVDEPEKKVIEEEKEEVPFEVDDFVLADDKPEVTKSDLVTRLKTEGLFSSLKEEDFKDMSDEDVPSLLEKEFETRIDETFEAFFEEMDEDAIAFLKFKKNGGNTEDFFKAYSSNDSMFPKGTIDDVSYQKKILEIQLRNEGNDADEIADRIAYLEEGGKLKANALKYEAKLLEKQRKDREVLLQHQEKEVQQAKENREKLSKSLMKTLDESDTLGNFVINKNDKKQLHQYITAPRVKVGKDDYVTQMQSDLSEVFKDPTKILILGKLLKSGFDLSSIETNLKTKVTKETREKLDGKSTTLKSSSTTTERSKKALSDYFD